MKSRCQDGVQRETRQGVNMLIATAFLELLDFTWRFMANDLYQKFINKMH